MIDAYTGLKIVSPADRQQRQVKKFIIKRPTEVTWTVDENGSSISFTALMPRELESPKGANTIWLDEVFE